MSFLARKAQKCTICSQLLKFSNRDTVICNLSVGGCGSLYHLRCEKLTQQLDADGLVVFLCMNCAGNPSEPHTRTKVSKPPSEIMELQYSPVLSFFEHAVSTGLSRDDVIAAAMNFFSDGELHDARALLIQIAKPPKKYPERRGATARSSLCDDIFSIFLAAKNHELTERLPKFVMTAGDPIPVIASEMNANLTRAIHTWDRQLKVIAGKIESVNIGSADATKCCVSETDFLTLKADVSDIKSSLSRSEHTSHGVKEWPPLGLSADQIVSLSVQAPPQQLSDPFKRKEALSKLTGSEGIKRVTVSKDSRWVVHVDKASAENLKLSLANEFSSSVEALSPKYIGLISNVSFDFDPAVLSSDNKGVLDAKRIGSSKCYKVFFDTNSAKSYYLRHGVFLGYEHYRVADFKPLPKMCSICCSLDHLSASCSNVQKCARCSSPDHVNSKDSQCQNSFCCCHCGSTEHPGYSFRCKVIRDRVSQNNKKI